jgi:hypothetical protein
MSTPHRIFFYSLFILPLPQSGVSDVYVCVHYLHHDYLPVYAHLVGYACHRTVQIIRAQV